MATTVQEAKRVGGSIMVRIPKSIVEFEGIRPGEPVQVEVQKARKDWFGALKGLAPFEKSDKLDVHNETGS